MMRSSNPALKDNVFNVREDFGAEPMTIQGTVSKTGLLLMLLLLGAAYSWYQIAPDTGGEGLILRGNPSPYIMVGSIGGLVLALILMFKKHLAPVLAPAYAVLEGLSLGALSAMFEIRYPGIAMQATLGTFGTLAALLLAYKSGWVRVTEGFKMGVVAATGAIMFTYLIGFVLQLFHIPMNFLHDSSPISIGISLIIVVVASLNLVMDFDFIEKGAQSRAPKYMEWYAGFALIVTLVWLYLEILRLLGKVRER